MSVSSDLVCNLAEKIFPIILILLKSSKISDLGHSYAVKYCLEQVS